MTASAEVLREGDLIARRYRVERLLGEGGFGVVYAAVDTTLDRPVAIKLLSKAGNLPADVLTRFRREAMATAALPADHVPAIYDVGEDGGRPYIAMELLLGHDLGHEVRATGTLAIGAAVGWVLEAILGVAHAHARGIVHRDLKPGNLFLNERGDGTAVVKVLDFGIAKLHGRDTLTDSGAMLGTPRYMAPEQIRDGMTVDGRTDVWALGVVLYELLTKKPIFEARDPASFAARVLVDSAVPVRNRRPDVPEALAAIVHRCVEKAQEARFPDLHALAKALGPFAAKSHRDIPERVRHVFDTGGRGVHEATTRNADDALPFADTETGGAKPTVSLDAPARAPRAHRKVLLLVTIAVVAAGLVAVPLVARMAVNGERGRNADASSESPPAPPPQETPTATATATTSTLDTPSSAIPPPTASTPRHERRLASSLRDSGADASATPPVGAIVVRCDELEFSRFLSADEWERATATVSKHCATFRDALLGCYRDVAMTEVLQRDLARTTLAGDGRVLSVSPPSALTGRRTVSPLTANCVTAVIRGSRFPAWGGAADQATLAVTVVQSR